MASVVEAEFENTMNDTSLRFNLGNIGTKNGMLSFSFTVNNDGYAFLSVGVTNSIDRRISGISLILDKNGYNTLNDLIKKTYNIIMEYRSSNQLRQMTIFFESDLSLEVDVGFVDGYRGRLSFSFVLSPDGRGHVRIFAYEPKDRRKTGIFIYLVRESFNDLLQIMDKSRELMKKLSASNQLKGFLDLSRS